MQPTLQDRRSTALMLRGLSKPLGPLPDLSMEKPARPLKREKKVSRGSNGTGNGKDRGTP